MNLSKYIKITLICLVFFLILFFQGCSQKEVVKKDFNFYYKEAEKAVLIESYESALNYYEQALEVYEEKDGLVGMNISEGTLYFNVGFCYEQLKDLNQAFTFYTKSLKDEHSKGLALNALGQLHFSQKDYELSKKCYEKALGIETYAYEACVNLSAIYSIEKDQSTALTLLNEAVSLDNTRPDAYVNRAFLFAQQGDEKLMRADIEALKNMNFSDLDVYIKIFNETLKEGSS